MDYFSKGNFEKGTVSSIFSPVSLLEGVPVLLPWNFVLCHSILGLFWLAPEFGDHWRNKSATGARSPCCQLEEGVEQAKTVQGKELP